MTTSSNTLTVKVSSKTQDGREVWEGTVFFPELKATKLVRKSDKSTTFGNRQSVVNAARQLATKYGFSEVSIEAPKAKKATAASTAE